MVKRTIFNRRSRSTKRTPVQRRTSKIKNRSHRKSAKFDSFKKRKSFQPLVDVSKTITPMKMLEDENESVIENFRNNVESHPVIEISDDESQLLTSSPTQPFGDNKFEESCFIIDVEPGVDECNKSKLSFSFKDVSNSENKDNDSDNVTDTGLQNSSTDQPSSSKSSLQYTCPREREKTGYPNPVLGRFFNDYQGRPETSTNNNWKIFKKNMHQLKNTSKENSLDGTSDFSSNDNDNSEMEILNVSNVLSTNELYDERHSNTLGNRQTRNANRRSLRRSKRILHSDKHIYDSIHSTLSNTEGPATHNELLQRALLVPDDVNNSSGLSRTSKSNNESNFKRKHSHQLNLALQKTRKLLDSNTERIDNAMSVLCNSDKSSTSDINIQDSLNNKENEESFSSSENIVNSDNSAVKENEKSCASSANLVNCNGNTVNETSDNAISVDSDSDIEFVDEYNPSEQFIELSDSENYLPREIPLPKKMKSSTKKKAGAKKAASKKKVIKKTPLKKSKTKEKSSSEQTTDKNLEGRLRPIVIDGCNVGMGHSRSKMLSVKGIQICCDYFVSRGHEVKVFLPSYRKFHPMTTDCPALNQMERKGTLILTPGRKVGADYIGSYDDRFIVEYASIKGAIVITRDNYRDLYEEREDFRDTIRNRLLQYTFVDDLIMFPSDPLGRQGPHLDEFLRFPPDQENAPVPNESTDKSKP